jgi:hypothetical protein
MNEQEKAKKALEESVIKLGLWTSNNRPLIFRLLRADNKSDLYEELDEIVRQMLDRFEDASDVGIIVADKDYEQYRLYAI